MSDEFLKSATNLFLINNPDAVYNSLSNIKPDFTEDEFGYTELYTLYERTCQIIGHRPALYTTEEFRNDPATILRQVCSFANMDFIPTMLHWSPGPIRKWEPHEVLSQSKWHRTTEQSNGILPYQKPVPLAINSSNKTPMIEAAWRIFTTLTKTVTQETQGTITSDNGKTI
ncbi:hypothetical protein [Candidatus Spongiihabitans sp.]|uniref:sulfotransferase-like domain-containing protein n=1 Tax=Candidatus Spongiihabitans sp. TaxID=3101308 RepID=UPI003C702F0A